VSGSGLKGFRLDAPPRRSTSQGSMSDGIRMSMRRTTSLLTKQD